MLIEATNHDIMGLAPSLLCAVAFALGTISAGRHAAFGAPGIMESALFGFILATAGSYAIGFGVSLSRQDAVFFPLGVISTAAGVFGVCKGGYTCGLAAGLALGAERLRQWMSEENIDGRIARLKSIANDPLLVETEHTSLPSLEMLETNENTAADSRAHSSRQKSDTMSSPIPKLDI